MSPRTKEQIAEIRKASSAQIAEAALALFAKRGFHATSVDEVAKAAGVSKGLIYNYFKNKDDLLRHIVESAIQMGDHLVQEAQRQVNHPLEKVYQIMDDLVGLLKANPTYWKLIFMLSMQEEIAKKFEDVINQHAVKNLSQLSDLLKDLGIRNHQMEALVLAATFDGLLLHFIQMGKNYPLDEVVKHIKQNLKKMYDLGNNVNI